MVEKIMSFTRRSGRAGIGYRAYRDETVPVEQVRAVATEAALATAVEGSPAVLVALWAHDTRLHPEHRTAGRRAR